MYFPISRVSVDDNGILKLIFRKRLTQEHINGVFAEVLELAKRYIRSMEPDESREFAKATDPVYSVFEVQSIINANPRYLGIKFVPNYEPLSVYVAETLRPAIDKSDAKWGKRIPTKAGKWQEYLGIEKPGVK